MNPWVIVALAVITLSFAVGFRGTGINAPVPIITLGLVIGLGYGVFTHDREQAQQSTRSAVANAAIKAHDDCIVRVEGRDGNRAMWIALGQFLADHGNADGAKTLRTLLDENIPALNVADCPPVPSGDDITTPTSTTPKPGA